MIEEEDNLPEKYKKSEKYVIFDALEANDKRDTFYVFDGELKSSIKTEEYLKSLVFGDFKRGQDEDVVVVTEQEIKNIKRNLWASKNQICDYLQYRQDHFIIDNMTVHCTYDIYDETWGAYISFNAGGGDHLHYGLVNNSINAEHLEWVTEDAKYIWVREEKTKEDAICRIIERLLMSYYGLCLESLSDEELKVTHRVKEQDALYTSDVQIGLEIIKIFAELEYRNSDFIDYLTAT
jgi:hypothetical protein